MARSMSRAYLAKRGVELARPLYSEDTMLRCQACGQTWSPNLQEGGRLARGFWRCPNGCNVGR